MKTFKKLNQDMEEALNPYKGMDKGKLEKRKNDLERSISSLRMKLKKSSAYGGNKEVKKEVDELEAKLRKMKQALKEEVELDENRLLKVSKISSAEYQKAKKLKGFDASKYKWNPDTQLYHKVQKEEVDLDEAKFKVGDEVMRTDKDNAPSGKIVKVLPGDKYLIKYTATKTVGDEKVSAKDLYLLSGKKKKANEEVELDEATYTPEKILGSKPSQNIKSKDQWIKAAKGMGLVVKSPSTTPDGDNNSDVYLTAFDKQGNMKGTWYKTHGVFKESVELDEASFNKTEKLPLTPSEKKIIGDTGVYKEKYKLDRTQSIYRASKTSYSMPFTGKEDLTKLKKLVSSLKEEVKLDEAVKTKVYKSGKYWLVDVTSSKIDYTDWGPTGRGFASEKVAQEFAKHMQKSVKESIELDEAVYTKGDTVLFYTGEMKNNRPVESKGIVVSSNKKESKVKVGSKIHTVDNEKIRGAVMEELDLEEVTSPEIKAAYDAAMKTEPRTPERKAAIQKYQKLRLQAIDAKKTRKEEVNLEEGKSKAADAIKAMMSKVSGSDKRDMQILAGKLENWASTGNPSMIADIVNKLADMDTDPREGALMAIKKADPSMYKSIMFKLSKKMNEETGVTFKKIQEWMKDFKQIDELKSSTYRSYIDKATQSQLDTMKKKKQTDKDNKTMRKRSLGIATAQMKQYGDKRSLKQRIRNEETDSE